MRWGLPLLLLLFYAFLAPGASGQAGSLRVYSNNVPTQGGLRGLHIDRSPLDPWRHGIVFDYGSLFAWGMGLDAGLNYSYPNSPNQCPDLVLAYSTHTNADNLRLRSDDARMELGPAVGHPRTPFQLAIRAGTPANPLGGLSIGTFSYQYSIHLYNRDPTIQRTCINFGSLWSWGTDLGLNGGSDLYLYNYQTNHATMTVSPDDRIGLAGALRHQGSQLGFFGATPVTRPVVTGSWSDGSAARNLCQAVAGLGLVQLQTSP